MRKLAGAIAFSTLLGLTGSLWAAAPQGVDTVSTALAVPALQVAAHPSLVVEAIDLAVRADRVIYTYRFHNTGETELRLAASLDLPTFEVGDIGETYRVSFGNPEDPIDLKMMVNGAPVSHHTTMRALALSIDRLAELKALNLPLLPFGPPIAKALKELASDDMERLVKLGVVSPPDKTGVHVPDWSLDILYSWELSFPAGKTTTIIISFVPITGGFNLDSRNAAAFDNAGEEICLTPDVVKSLKAKAAKAAFSVTDILVSVVKPVRWLDAPSITINVDKARPDTIAAFCASDIRPMSPTRVSGIVPEDAIADDFRVVLIAAGK